MKKLFASLTILSILLLIAPNSAYAAATTWNSSDKAASITLSGGNLVATNNNGTQGDVRGTASISGTQKIYFEVTVTATDVNDDMEIGVGDGSFVLTNPPRNQSTAWTLYGNNGNKCNSPTYTGYGSAYGLNAVVMVAVDMGAGKIWWGVNGTWIASGDPAAGTNYAFNNLTGTLYPVFATGVNTNAVKANFGATAFAYTPPTGFTGFDSVPVATILPIFSGFCMGFGSCFGSFF